MRLRAPFPWFGGKSRVAHLVWDRFGNVPNYVEPFAGSLAVLLGRPHAPRTETVNDLDCFVANFWRALAADPDGVAEACDWPVNEADLTARHRWLVAQTEFRARMFSDPHFFDIRIAGWWVWGLSAWIGDGWCRNSDSRKVPHLGDSGRGVHSQMRYASPGGKGVHRDQGRQTKLLFAALRDRLRRVRVVCGDWSRVLGPGVTEGNHGTTAVFLDPPYDDAEHSVSYATGSGGSLSSDVRAWAIEHGLYPHFRIALCGYEGEHIMPDDWTKVEWKAQGGYASDPTNSGRERVWFSPHCLAYDRRAPLFSE